MQHAAPVELVLPRDDAPHFNAPVEWWYWHGHLRAPDERGYGFHLAFFRLFELGRPRCVVHHALLDVGAGRLRQHHVTGRRGAPWVTDRFLLAMPPFHADGGAGVDELEMECPGAALRLVLRETRPPVLHHGTGYVDYEVGGNTWYYSRTRMTTEGVLSLDGAELPVQGTAWFDHQWGRLAPQMRAGWDWFGIQLDDGTDIMLFFRHLGGGRSALGATLVAPDGTSRCLDGHDVRLTARDSWCSPRTGARYAMGWRLQVDGLTLEIEPLCREQEIDAGFTRYWEGAATVHGDRTGRAYVELVGESLLSAG
ncbi:MAG: lipocalin family protein [Myxococcota bacterium]